MVRTRWFLVGIPGQRRMVTSDARSDNWQSRILHCVPTVDNDKPDLSLVKKKRNTKPSV